MSLPSLQWRKLPTRVLPINTTFTGSYLIDMMYDMLTGSLYHDGSVRVMGSGSAWQMPTKFITGSNTEAIYLYPPVQSAISQSVIFAAKSSTGASSSGVPDNILGGGGGIGSYGGYDLKMNSNKDHVYVALVKNASGSFTQWTSRYPFGSGSYHAGYAPVSSADFAAISAGDKITIFESKEAIATYFTIADVPYVTIAGAVIDPEQSSIPAGSYEAESDGRLYALIQAAKSRIDSSTAPGWSNSFNNFLTTTNLAFNNGTDDGSTYWGHMWPKFVAFHPFSSSYNGASSFITVQTTKFANDTFASPAPYDTVVTTPLRCTNGTKFIGSVRGIVAIKNTFANMAIKDSFNNTLGYTIGNSETSTGNAVLLPYS